MPTRITRLRETGAIILNHSCEVCFGKAVFGEGVQLKAALRALGRGDVQLATQLLGKWYCGEHRTIKLTGEGR